MKQRSITELRTKVFSLNPGETIHINLSDYTFSTINWIRNWIRVMVRNDILIPYVYEFPDNDTDAEDILLGNIVVESCTYIRSGYSLSAQGTQIRPIVEFVDDINLLSKCTFYNDDFLELDFETQKNFYRYCILHATEDVCKENIKVMKDEAAKLYFGDLF